MEAGDVLRLFLSVGGTFLLILTISSLAKKRITESFALFWGAISLIFIITGLSIRPVMLHSYISRAGLALIMLAVSCVTGGFFFVSVRASELARKNTELAIDISILHQEVEELEKGMEKIQEKVDKD